MKKEWTMEETVKMPVIALRGLTVFPNVLIHFDVSREISIKALEEAMASGDPVFLVGQKDIGVEYPEAKDLYTVGTVSNVRQILRTPGDNVRVMVEGGTRGSLKRLLRSAPFLEAEVQPIQEEKAGQNSAKTEALIQEAISTMLTGRTSFLIAHRLSTIRKADRILVVRGGKIVERGTHQQLMEQGGYTPTCTTSSLKRNPRRMYSTHKEIP